MGYELYDYVALEKGVLICNVFCTIYDNEEDEEEERLREMGIKIPNNKKPPIQHTCRISIALDSIEYIRPDTNIKGDKACVVSLKSGVELDVNETYDIINNLYIKHKQ